jgi:SAM-dependent methyltransferase
MQLRYHRQAVIRQLLTLVRRTGPLQTLALLLSYLADLIFDLRYGTNTATWVNLKRLSIPSENLRRGVDYQPTQVLPLRRVLSELEIPRDKIFVDLGCGKGRVLMLAAEAGFRDLRGVEFSAELCALATTNCAKYKKKTNCRADFRLTHSDVVDYPVRDEEVFFMFNPFDDHVLGIVLQRIVDSLTERARQIWIIYRNPVHEAVLERNPAFSKLREYTHMGSDFAVYTNAASHEHRG